MFFIHKALLPFLLLATATSFAASELTTAEEHEINKELSDLQAAALKSAGVPSSFKTSERAFLRNGVKVAAIITSSASVRNNAPQISKSVQFYIDANNWIVIDLSDPQQFNSHFVAEVTVEASKDSITVTAFQKGYCEVFFKSTGKFMDGAQRESYAAGYLRAGLLAKPR